ncbi:cytochrome c [Hoeflea sp. AS16]|uniref:c-type cytochrome n=1 Tax=Hoeflea sp. AS16 TaxID=3135779 RepID=UPI0031703C10
MIRKSGVTSLVVAMAFGVSALCLLAGATPARAQSGDEIEQGRDLVQINCGKCHAVGEADASPHHDAPAFRKLSDSFPMDALEEAFSDGRIYSGHPDMPEFIATPEQVDAIIAYIASLQG